MIRASIALMKSNNSLVPAGRGLQPAADFNKGDDIGEEETPCSDRYLWVILPNGKRFKISHSNYYEA